MQSSAKQFRDGVRSLSGNLKRILVVEDDPDQTLLLEDYLESYFYRVTAASNGVDGLKAVMEADFDVILCDIVMPAMPGDMFYHAIQRVKPQLCGRFIFLTAHPENSRVRDFLNRVSGKVLMKPFHLDDLLEMILLLFRELEDPTAELASPEESGPAPMLPPIFPRDRLRA
jgi:CheY-like chemotaxis protein